MKAFKSLMTLVVLSQMGSAWAAPAPYIANPMICTGKIFGDTRNVHSSYFQLLMKLQTVYSVRRDRSKALTLEVSNAYYGPREKIDPAKVSFGEVWYMGPLAIEGDIVARPSLSGRGDDLKLKRVGTKRAGNRQIDQFLGVWTQPNSVGGNIGYQLSCEAVVTAQPTRVIDLTRK